MSREGVFPLRHTVQQSTKNFALCTLSCSITSFVLVVPLMTFGVWGKVLGRGDKYGGAMFGVRGVGKSNHDQGNVQQMSRWEIQSGKERSANT